MGRNVYYRVDGGPDVFIGSGSNNFDYTFNANFSQSIRVYVNVNQGVYYAETLYVDGTQVASGTVGNEGLTYTIGTPPPPQSLPPDVNNLVLPSGISSSIEFGDFTPPVPFSASDQTKMNAPITQTRSVTFSNYPVGNEMVRIFAKLSGDVNHPIPAGLNMTVNWYNKDTGALLFSYPITTAAPPAGYVFPWYGVYSWIGHKDVGEIDRTGTYEVDFVLGAGQTSSFKSVGGGASAVAATTPSVGVVPSSYQGFSGVYQAYFKVV